MKVKNNERTILMGENMKKIKQYFDLRRRILIEVLETLCSICKYLDYDGHFGHNPHSRYLGGHFVQLKSLSEELRGKK
jgi:hypothetical protein